MSRQQRIAIEYLVWGGLVLVLMMTNEHVSWEEHVQRVQPFFMGGVFWQLVVIVLILQAVKPSDVPWWQVWRWMYPFVVALMCAAQIVAIYFMGVWAGFSGRFDMPPVVYDVIRVCSWPVFFLGTPLLIELALSSLHARRTNTTQEHYVYENDNREGVDA